MLKVVSTIARVALISISAAAGLASHAETAALSVAEMARIVGAFGGGFVCTTLDTFALVTGIGSFFGCAFACAIASISASALAFAFC